MGSRGGQQDGLLRACCIRNRTNPLHVGAFECVSEAGVKATSQLLRNRNRPI